MAVQTVLGTVKASELGRTLTHEHFALNFTHFYREPPKQIEDKFGKISLQNVGFIRQYPYSSKYNLLFDDRDATTAVLNDVIAYKKYGGGAIVENTTTGLGRNLELMKTASEQSGVHVIAGTGYYLADLQDASSLTLSREYMYEVMLEELVMGCKDTPSIKAGFMGEIGSVWPIKEFEKNAIAAAGEVQEQVKCGVSFHPHRVQEAPFEIMRIYLEAGGDAKKAVMSHLDRTLVDDSKLLEFAELGCYCQLDLFGVEVSYYQLNNKFAMPSDAQRISKVKLLVDERRTNQVLMSHDIHTKHRLMDFGGHGYSHILNNILPVMKDRGITQDQIDQITIANPAKWLTIDSAH